MEDTRDEVIKRCFSSYVKTAIVRVQQNYLKKEHNVRGMEETVEIEKMMIWKQEMDEAGIPGNQTEQVFSVSDVRQYLKEQAPDWLIPWIGSLTERETVIVFCKVFREMSFKEIGAELELDWKKAASVYSYARKKLKKGWEKYEF